MEQKIIDNKIFNLAHDLTNYGLKNNTNYTALVKNRKCGDKIKVELKIKNKKIINMKYETESCIFCQASASYLSKNIKNFKIHEIDKLTSNKKFKFLFSKKYFQRKDCILLPFNAVKKAI